MLKKSGVLLFAILVVAVSLVVLPTAALSATELKLGSRGEDVTHLQRLLQVKGLYSAGDVSGYFGFNTLQAVIEFESKHGFKPDGTVGQGEWKILQGQNSPAKPEQRPVTEKLTKLVLGYYTEDYPGDKLSYNSLLNNYQLIDYIATFDYLVDARGNLKGQTSEAALQLAKSKGVKPLLLIHNISGGIDTDAAYSAVSETANRANLINNIMSLVQKYGYGGVNIDLEGIPASGRQSLNTFLTELGKRLKAGNYLLTLSVPAKTYDDPGNNWTGAYDYTAFGRLADLVVIMTYDEHWFGGPPGPVASLPWVRQVLNYAVGQIPREKIMMGIGAFGYDWPEGGKGKAIRWNAVNNLINKYGNPQWDDTNSVPYLIYQLDGVKHEVWFENASSLRLKLDLVNSFGIGGIAFWRLGFEDESFWLMVKNKF